jgi:phage terminase large subunit
MDIKTTKVLQAILEAWDSGKRRIKLEGGTWSSKTYSALQALQIIAEKSENALDISVVAESLPHLKQGCIRDFFNILDEDKDTSPFYNKTDHIYRRPDWKGRVQFFGADDDSKVRGPRRHILFINEANNIPWETARGLDIRTELFTILDWNPVGEFWAHENWTEPEANAYDHSTYLDAIDVIPADKVADIESYRDKDPNWWNIYGLGLIGKIEGLVYPHFEQVEQLPLGEVFYGLDFGFSADPTVLVKNVILGDSLYSQEQFYDASGLTNDQIARKLSLMRVKKEPVYPDPNEPKSAEELRKFGFNVIEAVKGKGSVEYGIQKVNQFYQYWTKDSLNCIKEQRNFRYLKDRQTGELTNKTTHAWSHGMDARRYAVATHKLSGLPGSMPVWKY